MAPTSNRLQPYLDRGWVVRALDDLSGCWLELSGRLGTASVDLYKGQYGQYQVSLIDRMCEDVLEEGAFHALWEKYVDGESFYWDEPTYMTLDEAVDVAEQLLAELDGSRRQ